MPPGTARYWSWLFAARNARGPLLGIYALAAEWRALTDPGTDAAVANIKLLWWQDEVRRLNAGSPLHPITRFISDLPGATAADLSQLDAAIQAASAEAAGAPLERGVDLDSHAEGLYGIPLLVAARMGSIPCDVDAVRACTGSLASAQFLARAVCDYRREAHAGRVLFPVDELLAAGIDNDDLAADVAPPRLQAYIGELREKAARHFSIAAQALRPADRPALRHLSVLATLGAKHLNERRSAQRADFHFSDLYKAWNTARRATSGR